MRTAIWCSEIRWMPCRAARQYFELAQRRIKKVSIGWSCPACPPRSLQPIDEIPLITARHKRDPDKLVVLWDARMLIKKSGEAARIARREGAFLEHCSQYTNRNRHGSALTGCRRGPRKIEARRAANRNFRAGIADRNDPRGQDPVRAIAPAPGLRRPFDARNQNAILRKRREGG